MNGILRTWRCLNRACDCHFDSWEPNPACPNCGCVRVDWLPRGGHVGGVAKVADAELRALADIFRMDDMNSAERGKGAKKVTIQPLPDPRTTPARNFGPFAASVDPIANLNNGYNGAQCVPTANKVDYRIKAAPGHSLPANPKYPKMTDNTVIDATYRPPK